MLKAHILSFHLMVAKNQSRSYGSPKQKKRWINVTNSVILLNENNGIGEQNGRNFVVSLSTVSSHPIQNVLRQL